MVLKTKPVESTTESTKEITGSQRAKCTISQTMIDLMVRQIWHELYNHNLYRSFANFFGRQGLTVLEEYYIDRSEEEKHHHNWIYGYLSDCDAEFIYPEVPAIKERWKDNVEPFELTVKAEIETTMLIHEMVQQALNEGDWATFNWLQGNDDEKGRLTLEQLEEEAISRTALDIARIEGSWLIKQDSIMDAYKGD